MSRGLCLFCTKNEPVFIRFAGPILLASGGQKGYDLTVKKYIRAKNFL